jgi:hypothetical protein
MAHFADTSLSTIPPLVRLVISNLTPSLYSSLNHYSTLNAPFLNVPKGHIIFLRQQRSEVFFGLTQRHQQSLFVIDLARSEQNDESEPPATAAVAQTASKVSAMKQTFSIPPGQRNQFPFVHFDVMRNPTESIPILTLIASRHDTVYRLIEVDTGEDEYAQSVHLVAWTIDRKNSSLCLCRQHFD